MRLDEWCSCWGKQNIIFMIGRWFGCVGFDARLGEQGGGVVPGGMSLMLSVVKGGGRDVDTTKTRVRQRELGR